MDHDESQDEKIRRLIAERDQFLAENPELKPMQKEIDATLNKVGSDPNLRLKKLAEMISKTIDEEYKPELNNLKNLIEKEMPVADTTLRRKVK